MKNLFKNIISNWDSKKLLRFSAWFLAVVVVGIIAWRWYANHQTIAFSEQTSVTKVKVQSLAESHQAVRTLEYPALVSAEQEAKVFARANGSLRGSFSVGDSVTLGQELAQIEELGSVINSGSNSTQIKQATIVVNQAKTAYDLARRNYDNLLSSSLRDIELAKISRDQAATGQTNLGNTSKEAIKSAELAYESAKLALDNAKKKSVQSSGDSNENASLAIDSALNSVSVMLTNINNITAFDDKSTVNINYRINLGAADSGQYSRAKDAYVGTNNAYRQHRDTQFDNLTLRLDSAIKLVERTKSMLGETRLMLDKSISSSDLSQATLTGFQASVASYETQMTAVLSQLRSARQGLDNLDLNNDSLIDSLTKSLELAQQNLNSLKAGNLSQSDQATYAVTLANNQYESIKIKLDSQLASAQAQLDSAMFQYQNANVALESLYDNHQVIAPLDGVITQKLVADAETVSAGQLLAVVSQTDSLLVRFYVEEEVLSYFKPAVVVQIKDNNGVLHQGLVSAVSPQADPVSKRYQVDVRPQADFQLSSGSIVNVVAEITSVTATDGSVILPLSAINVGQNDSYLWLIDGDQAKKQSVTIEQVIGEYAQVQISAPADTKVIVDGSRFLKEGDQVKSE